MTIKDYLKQAYKLDQRIDSHLEELARLREVAYGLSSPRYGDKVQTSVDGNAPFVTQIESIIRYEDRINAEIDTLVALKEQIHETIAAVGNPRAVIMLRSRYIDGKTWEQIAASFRVDVSTVYHWHRDALLRLKMPENPIVI